MRGIFVTFLPSRFKGRSK